MQWNSGKILPIIVAMFVPIIMINKYDKKHLLKWLKGKNMAISLHSIGGCVRICKKTQEICPQKIRIGPYFD